VRFEPELGSETERWHIASLTNMISMKALLA
jgi:hypothetical protein